MLRRRPGRLERPDSVYQSVVRLASRLGYRPQPTQTVYEYTGMLADVVPQAREPLDVVATAAVEVTYGKRQLGTDRLTIADGLLPAGPAGSAAPGLQVAPIAPPEASAWRPGSNGGDPAGPGR